MIDTKKLEEASAAYYVGEPIMTDSEFDQAITELREANPNHPFLKRVGAPVPGTLKVKHRIPMGSLCNANNSDEFLAWLPRHNAKVCLSHKMDGASLELIYEDGHLVQAITRGDGVEGEDVTKNVFLSPHVPLKVHRSIISVRCECVIHLDDWHKHFSGDANPRNSASGTLRRHDGLNARYLRFYAFDAISKIGESPTVYSCLQSEYETLQLLSEWFDVPAHEISHYSIVLVDWFETQECIRTHIPYEIDGVVAKIDDRKLSAEMGSKDNCPNGQIAIKFTPRGGETVLRNVVWQVGHTGALAPVGEVDPVSVGGTSIRRVTLCNIDEIERLDIAIGDTVEIIRAADVIPKLSRRIKKSPEREAIVYPDKCPDCGGKTAKDGAKLFCMGDYCSGQEMGRVMTWIKKRNILELGESAVRGGFITRIPKLYTRDLDQWSKTPFGKGTMGEKRAKKVMASLEKSRDVEFYEFLGSIGIQGVGRSLCKVLCSGLNITKVEDVFEIQTKQIESIEGFGPARALMFWHWIQEHMDEIFELGRMMHFQDATDEKFSLLSGQTVCFTGKSPKPRKEMAALAESVGATVSNSVNHNTTILVLADLDSTSSKAVKAHDMGIVLMSPEDFLTQVEESK